MLEPGHVLAHRYEIRRKLGQGGSAQVYLAYDRNSGRNRALKEIKFAGDGKVHKRVQQEAELVWQLNYPYFPEIFEVLTMQEADYIVMEYLEGETLGNRLRRAGPQPWQEVRRWGKDLCLMLEYLHQHTPSLIYQDMKPDNVMVQPRGNLRLIDFGTVLKVQEGREGLRLGTKGFAAPEQFDYKKNIDVRTDVYSLGQTLCQLLTGYEPGEFSDREFRISGRRRFPRKLNKILRKCIRENPEDRYQSCQQLREALCEI